MPLKWGMIVQPQKETFHIPELRKHSLKISRNSLHNYYLLAFTENWKNTPKKRHFIFFLITNKFFGKLRVAHSHEFWMQVWKKSC